MLISWLQFLFSVTWTRKPTNSTAGSC